MNFYSAQDAWHDQISWAEEMDGPFDETHTDADLGWPEGAVAAVEKASFPDESSEVRYAVL